MTSRLVAVLLALLTSVPCGGLSQTITRPVSTSTAPSQTVDYGQGWRATGNGLVPRVRLAAEILDSQPAVLEAEVKSGGAPYTYSVGWGDGSRPEPGRRHTGGPLRLTHDYNKISTFRVVLQVRVDQQTTELEVGLLTVRDDDDDPPALEWTLPKPLLRPGEPAAFAWKISDASGLAFVVVDVDGPNGRIGHFEAPEGKVDITGHGLGAFVLQVRTADKDSDRPGDSLGYLISESVVVTDDLDGDGLLDYLDNCPRQANRDQRDGDNDGLGDLCDPCPQVNGPCKRPGTTAGAGVFLGLALASAWKRRPRRARLLWLAVAGILVPTAAAALPVVTSIRPTASLVGEPVVIEGSGFGASQGATGRVTFGGVDAGTVYHWTDTRITVEVPVGSLAGGVPTPTPTGPQLVVVRTAAGEESSALISLDIKRFNALPWFRHACRCGDPGCVGPCLPDDYCRRGAGGCTFDGSSFGWRDIKDVDFGDIDDDGDLDIVDISSPNCSTCPAGVMPGIPFYCSSPVNFPDRLFINEGNGRYRDHTGGADGDYATADDNPLPYFHSYRTYDADLVDVNNDGYLDFVRADRNFCAGEASHYFKNVDTNGDGVPDKLVGFALAASDDEAYWDNLATGDLEPDGDLDLLVSHSTGTPSTHMLQINDGTGSFTLYNPTAMAPMHAANDDFTTFQDSAHDMALADLDGDRDQDIVIGGGNHGIALRDFVLLNRFSETGELFFESIPIPNETETSRTVHVGTPDLNGDGRSDVHFVNYSFGPADRLFLNLGSVGCAASCGDGLSCPAGLVVPNRICWRNASSELPEEVAGFPADGYGADYGDVDADGDLDILVTGLESPGNYLFLNRAGSACAVDPDCPSPGYTCVSGGCRPASAETIPKWWSCPTMGSGATAVPCRDRTGVTLTGPGFPASREDRRSLAVVFGDADGDVDIDILWGHGQWGSEPWSQWPDAGPLLLVADGERPYVKRVTVLSGPRIVYQAAWAPNAADTHLVVAPATFNTAAPFTALRTQDLHIEVEFSEPMAAASLTAVTAAAPATSLGVVPTLASSQPAGARTIWRGTLSNLAISDSGAHDGTHTITVTGTDAVGNQLLAIGSRADIAAGALRGGAAGSDTIHGFRIGPLEGTIPITAIFMKRTPADPPAPSISDRALMLQTALNDYFKEVSYDEIELAVDGHGWYQLAQPLDTYYTTPQTPLVELVQEAIDDAVAGGVDLSTAGYLLVVTEETDPRDEWSTTGGWPYTVSGSSRLIAAGVLNLATTNPRLNQLSGRLVGLLDLFEHPGVTFSRPFVGPWSLMGVKRPAQQVHVLGWEKWRAGWIDETGSATGETLTRVAKPPVASPIFGLTHTLRPLDSNDNGQKMVVIELADGLHFTAEYRRQQNLDSMLPDAGVLLTKVNDRIPLGEGPAIVLESPVAGTAGDLADAPFVLTPARNVFTDVSTGVRVEVIEVIDVDPAQAQIRLDYAVPSTQNDVFVEPPNDQWVTADIWVDAPNVALELEPDPRTVQGANERPVTGRLNKVIGRIRNSGPADATNFEVELEILEPWGTDGPWRSLKVKTVPLLQAQTINPSADVLIEAEWWPTGDVHTCVRLRVRAVANDGNTTNNETQENIHEFVSSPSSPYAPVTSRFQIENPYEETVPVLFRLDGLPAGWTKVVTPERPVLAPREVATAQITLQPPNGAPLCTREEITLTAYTPRVDTLKRIGTGISLAVELKSPAALTVETLVQCDQRPIRLSEDSGGFDLAFCRLETRGCTDPGLPNTEVAIVYTRPDGSTAVRYVTTDEAGCFVDLQPGEAPGLWQVGAVLEEEDCRAGARTPVNPVFVPLGFGRFRRLGVFTGGNWPADDLDDHSAAFMFAAQLEWPLTSSASLGVQVGYHAFDAHPPAGVDNLGFTNLSAVARWVGAGTVLRPFAQVGIGGYHESGVWDPGFQLGGGIEVPVTQAVSLASGITAHRVNRNAKDGTDPTWVDAYLGFFVALP